MSRLALACVLAIAVPRATFADEPAPPAPAPEPTAPAPAPTPPPAPAPAASEEPAADRVTARPPTASREIVVEVPGERTRNNKLLVGGLLAVGVIGSALGVYWHLDSRDAADAVSADEITGEAWTSEHVAQVDRAARSKTRATIAYSIGGAFLIGAIATYIFTEPKGETEVIRTGVSVTPTSNGGTVVSKMWSF